MNGIQGFYVGGRTEIGTQKQKKSTGMGGYEKSIRERQRDNNKEKQFQQKRQEVQQEFVQDNNFLEDLKKLVGPRGSGTFLFTQHPLTKQFMAKYGLDAQDIIKLRTGVTQRGFQGNIRDVGAKALGNLRLTNFFDPKAALSLFKEGMSPKDVIPSTRAGFMGDVENLFNKGPFAGIARFLAGSTPQGGAGLFYGNQLNPEGDRLFTREQAQQLGAVSANFPDVYNQLMQTPQLMQRGIDEFSYSTQRGLPTGGGNREVKPEPDPITAAYNPAMNPFLNQGIQPFSYMV